MAMKNLKVILILALVVSGAPATVSVEPLVHSISVADKDGGSGGSGPPKNQETLAIGGGHGGSGGSGEPPAVSHTLLAGRGGAGGSGDPRGLGGIV